jgi:hypothetical protein
MKATIVIFLIVCTFSISSYADVNPNPIQIKGIIPNQPVNIQMVSEIVTVDLFKDSSTVNCVFNMHNLGNSQNLEIGFPIMNFYLWTFQVDNYLLDDANKNNFHVTVNGKKVETINMYVPANLKKILKSINSDGGYKLLDEYTNQNRPWYLWEAHFDKNESQQITVKYVLPNGANHLYSFFNYLLSTGAGWAGKIENARIIVNLKDIPVDQIIDVAPKNYKQQSNIITWDFKNVKPTINDDILIKYERVKGSYAAEMEKLNKTQSYIDNKKVSYSQLNQLKATDIASVSVAGNPRAIIIYTKRYALENFKNKIKSINQTAWEQISNESVDTFANAYNLIVNSKAIQADRLFDNLIAIDTSKILSMHLTREKAGRETISITK